jgi:hypothetical protein
MSEQNVAGTTTVREQGFRREFLWLAPALLSAVLLFYFYLRSHPYPSFGAGLYLLIAEQISQAGYALPQSIPYYTEGGVPFAYPPLMFYVVAAIQNLTGLDPITVTRFLPGIVTIAYLVPTYLLARDLLNSRPQAALASLIVAVSPPVIQWHISAGGIVRAPAFLFALTGIYAGLRLYRDRDQRWVVPSLVLFTLTVLTHPVYTVFFALSYFLLFLEYDRTLWGLTRGAVVGFGGLLLAAPWWTQVMAYHGVDVFTSAAGTHGGIGGGIPSVASLVNVHPDSAFIGTVWSIVPILGVAYLLTERRYFLPVWFATVAFALGKSRFTLTVGSLVVAVFLLEVVGGWLKHESSLAVGRRGVVTVSLVLIAVVGLSGGAMYATGDVNAHAGSPSLPQFIDQNDVAAMNWVEDETDADATFVVQGDAAEWFPQQTTRTMLVGPWGVEWEGHEPYNRQLGLYRDVSSCNSATCMTQTLSEEGVEPDYVYLPKGKFTVRGMQYQRTSQLAMSMHLSPRYQTVFENDGVIIFEMVDETDETSGTDGTGEGESADGEGKSADGEES